MKRKILIAVIFLSAIVLCTHLNFCSADEVSEIKEYIQGKESVINKWRLGAHFLLTLTISVGVLGVLAAAFQKSKSRWSKKATVIVGVAISILTVILNGIPNKDYRTIYQSYSQARKLIDDIHYLLIIRNDITNENDIIAWRKEMQEKIKSLTNMGSETAKLKTKFDITSPVYAQAEAADIKEPSWIHQPPRGKDNFYFVGCGSGTSINEARSNSHKASLDMAKTYVKNLILDSGTRQGIEVSNTIVHEFSESIVKSAVLERTFLTYNRESRIYSYYSLLRVNKELLDINVRLFAAQDEVNIPVSFREDIKNKVQNRH